MEAFEIVLLIALILLGIGVVLIGLSIFMPKISPRWYVSVPVLGLIMFMISIIMYFTNTTIMYGYIDLDGNDGFADYCDASDGLNCRLKDGTRIMVKSYKPIQEGRYDY